MEWTSDDLVAAVRRRAMLPDAAADGALDDADILALADEEIALRLMPLVRSAREDYFVTYEDTTIVSGTARYRIPERAQGSALRDVTLVDSGGNERSIPRVSLEDAGDWERYAGALVFVMEGADVRLVPTPTSALGTLRMRYHYAHSRLVPVSEAPVGAVDTGTGNIVTLENDAGDALYADYLAGAVWLDCVLSRPPFGTLMVRNLISTMTASSPFPGVYSIAMTDDVPSDVPTLVEVNRLAYVPRAGETPIVALPRECWPLLISATASRVLRVVGDRGAAHDEYALYEREAGNVIALLTPRVEGARKKIIDHNSPLRRGGRR